MSKTLTHDQLVDKGAEMEAILTEFRELARQAGEILRGTGAIKTRAEAYWLGHILGYCDGENRYEHSIPDTIRELYGVGRDED